MANLTTTGLDEIVGSLEELANIPDDTILDMLTAEAEVYAEEQKRAFNTAYHKGYGKGITAEKVTYSKTLKLKKGVKCIYVYPMGDRQDSRNSRTGGNVRRAASVAFINEHGSERRNIPKRLTVRTANAKAEVKAVEAATDVYGKYLKSKNL